MVRIAAQVNADRGALRIPTAPVGFTPPRPGRRQHATIVDPPAVLCARGLLLVAAGGRRGVDSQAPTPGSDDDSAPASNIALATRPVVLRRPHARAPYQPAGPRFEQGLAASTRPPRSTLPAWRTGFCSESRFSRHPTRSPRRGSPYGSATPLVPVRPPTLDLAPPTTTNAHVTPPATSSVTAADS